MCSICICVLYVYRLRAPLGLLGTWLEKKHPPNFPNKIGTPEPNRTPDNQIIIM